MSPRPLPKPNPRNRRKPPPPVPQTGRPMCALGKAVAAVILVYVLAAFVGIVTA